MQSFIYSPQKLIEEVKARPSLWDSHHKQYRNQVRKTQMWKEIALIFTKDTPKSKTEIVEIARELQKKWKGIRDAFFKYLHNPNRTKRPYIYIELLRFLEEFKPRNRPSVASAPNGCESDEDSSQMQPSAEDMISSESEEEKVVIKVAPPSPSTFAFANTEVPSTSSALDSEDCDRLFLLSLLPHLKTIPAENRLNVKVEIMQLIRNANQGY